MISDEASSKKRGDHILCSSPDPKATRWRLFYQIVRNIPAGKVATYGQVAALAGLDGHSRQVGYALHALPPTSDVPWHRVVNVQGEVSPRTGGDSHELPRMLLEGEGVEFDARGRIAMKRFRLEAKPKPERPV